MQQVLGSTLYSHLVHHITHYHSEFLINIMPLFLYLMAILQKHKITFNLFEDDRSGYKARLSGPDNDVFG